MLPRLKSTTLTACLFLGFAITGPTALLARQNPAPSGVRVQGTGTSVTISWAPLELSGITYRVLRALDARTTGTDLTSPVTAASFVDATTSPATTYYYQVVAVYRRENVASVPVAFTTPALVTVRSVTGTQPLAVAPTTTTLISRSAETLTSASRVASAPPPPANLTAVPAGFKSVSLTWAVVSGVSSYRVFGPALPAAGVMVSSQPYRVTDVPSGAQTFTISSEYTGASNGPGLPKSTVVVAPFSGMAASTALEQGSIVANFDFNVTAAEPLTFHLYRDDGRGGAQSELTTGVSWNRSAGSVPGIAHITGRSSPGNLVPGLDYKYQIAVGVAGGDLIPTPLMPLRIPLAPANLTAAPAAEFKTVSLTWALVPGVATYRMFGPTLPAAGVMVSGQPYRVMNVPSGAQTFAISSEYGGVTNGPSLPHSTVIVPPFYGVTPGLSVERTSTAVDINFTVTAAEALTFHLYRDDGKGGEQKEITSSVQWARLAGPLPGTAQVQGRSFPTDLMAGLEYKYQLAVALATGDLIPTPFISVRIPQFLVRATVPLSNDRAVVEWNLFGTAPYRVRKGVQTLLANGALSLPMDFIRDAAGNPINFTGVKFEDFVVQHGITYFYEVCANTVAPYTQGMSCPGVAVAVP